MAARCEVEMDIFSGMPNPSWILTTSEAGGFLKRLAALPPASARAVSGHLGYRGFIVQVTRGSDVESIRVQRGVVHTVKGASEVHARDNDRELERWLLDTGRPHLDSDVLRLVERELPADPPADGR